MSELTERYVGATLRTISDEQRADIEAELRAAIDDAVEAKVAGGQPLEVAEEEVLTELGDPDRLASDYSGRPGYLIGPELFFDYKRLLTALLVTVVPVTAIVVSLVGLLDGAGAGAAIGGAASLLISLAVHIGFWTTLVFAILERTGNTSPTGKWTPANLPPLTPKTGGISLGDTIASVVFLVITIVGLILARNTLGATTDGGQLVPLFEPAMWDFWLPFLVAVLMAEVVFEFVKYRVGRWNQSLAWVNVVLNLGFVVPAIYLLVNDLLLNPEFFAALPWTGTSTWLDGSITATVVVIVAVAVWDIFDGFHKASRAGRA